MTDTITMNQHSLTRDGNNPVYKVQKGDGRIEAIDTGEELYIPMVMCGGQTKLSTVVTHAVEQLEQTTVKFPNVLNPELIEKLDGFEQTYEYSEGYGEQVEVWVGEWEPEENE